VNRIENLYKSLKGKRSAFNAYLCAGDPDLDTTHDMILAFEKSGVDMIELGMPFSDPVADGPVIQAAGQRAIERGVTLPKVLELVQRVRKQSQLPIALMTYYNIIHKFGIERTVRECKAAGIDGFVIPDLIPEEAGELIAAARAAELATIFFVAPTSTDDRVALADRESTGFIYCVSVTGITGARTALPDDLRDYIVRTRAKVTKPLVVGFGVSNREQVQALGEVADGVIVGSAIVREIEAASRLPRAEMVKKVAAFASELAGTRR